MLISSNGVMDPRVLHQAREEDADAGFPRILLAEQLVLYDVHRAKGSSIFHHRAVMNEEY